MSGFPFFPEEEYAGRLQKVRRHMAARDLDAALISVPENIYYLTGLSHQGFFATHVLIVPLEREMVLVARAMEQPTVAVQVTNARFCGYGDSDDPAQVTARRLVEMGLGAARLGMEQNSSFLPLNVAAGIMAGVPEAEWVDVSNLVDDLRLVKSERELVYVRQAAAVSDAMMQAALDTAAAGVNEREIAAEIHRAMILAGGEYPGFTPFVRSTPTLPQEHETWRDRNLAAGDRLFLEMAGCVARYHAPLGRLVFVDAAPLEIHDVEQLCLEAFAAVVETIRPGVTAREVYAAWQARVDAAGLAHYRRHHCGYLVGIGFPPSWVGGNRVLGLRHDSDRVLRPGMTFHLMSWLMGTGRGDYFVSDTAVLTETGGRVLTTIPQQCQVV